MFAFFQSQLGKRSGGELSPKVYNPSEQRACGRPRDKSDRGWQHAATPADPRAIPRTYRLSFDLHEHLPTFAHIQNIYM